MVQAGELGRASSMAKRPVAPQSALDVPGSLGTRCGVQARRHGPGWQEGPWGSRIPAPLSKTGPPVRQPSPPPGSAPGVPLRSPAAEAVAALPGAVDEALSIFAFFLDGGIQNGLVQEVDLRDTGRAVRRGRNGSRFSPLS